MDSTEYTLRDWLRTGDRSVPWLAEQVGVSPATVYDWMSFRRSPELRSALLIERLSGGMVTPRKLVPPEWASEHLDTHT